MAKWAGKRKRKAGERTDHHQQEPAGKKRQKEFVDSVIRLAEPLCDAEGLELVHVEYQREPGGLTLRTYIDKPGGVTLDNCVDISRQLDDILDVHTKDAPPYRLEVSSPGIDRPVGKIQDFTRFEGHRVRISINTEVNGRKNFTGVLAGIVDGRIRILVDTESVDLDFENIKRARLINYNGEH